MAPDHVVPLELQGEQLIAEYEDRQEVELNASVIEHGAYRLYKIFSSTDAAATVELKPRSLLRSARRARIVVHMLY